MEENGCLNHSEFVQNNPVPKIDVFDLVAAGKKRSECVPCILALGLILFASLKINCEAKDDAVTPIPTHGFFRCPAGRLNIIDATAAFSVLDEDSTTYSLQVGFCYDPMTTEDVTKIKSVGGSWGLSRERQKSLQVPGFPGPFIPELHFELGEWPIGHPPPESGDKIENLYFRSSGKTTQTFTIDDHPEKWKVEWTTIPDKNEFIVKGHCISSVTSTGCEWDIAFEARTHGWARAKYGLKRRERDQTNNLHSNGVVPK